MYRLKSQNAGCQECKYGVSENRQQSMNTDKSTDLFSRLEQLMAEKQLYRDKMISRDRVAEELGTNRTYISNIISEATGKSFTQYINSFRVAECVEILSNTNDETNLKTILSDVGFNSTATFYRIFQDEVGMPPAKFRELAKKAPNRH